MADTSRCLVSKKVHPAATADLSVMIVSYETLRTLQDELANCEIGLLLADEGHRLKNAGQQFQQ